MEVYKSKYWIINFEEENALMNPRWLEESGNMSTEEYKSEMLKYVDLVKKYRPDKALIDNFKCGYAIEPVVQEWVNENFFPPILAVGVKRIAILMPEEIVLQLSLEQVMEESRGLEFETKYFSNEQVAREWLMSE